MLEPEPDPEPKDYYYYTDHSIATFIDNSGNLVFVFDGKTVVQTDDVCEYLASDVYKTCAIYYNSENSLFCVSQDGYVKVDNDVVTCELSMYGDVIVYLKAGEDGGARSSLCLYDTKKKTSLTVEQSAYFSDDIKLTLSPDGKTFTYNKDFRIGSGIDTYISVDGAAGKPQLNGSVVDYISEDAEYLLWHNRELLYYIRCDGVDTPLNIDMPTTLFSNRSCTEFVFSRSSGGTYLVTNGRNIKKLCDGCLLNLNFPTYALTGSENISLINHFRVKLFSAAKTITGTRGLCYINGRLGTAAYSGISITKGSYVSYNMSVVYYTDENGNLYKFDNDYPEDKTVLSSDALPGELFLSDSGKDLFYVNSNNELCYLARSGIISVAKISGDTYMGRSGAMYFLGKDYHVYSTMSGREPVAISFDGKNPVLYGIDGDIFILSEGRLYSLDRSGKAQYLIDNIILYS